MGNQQRETLGTVYQEAMFETVERDPGTGRAEVTRVDEKRAGAEHNSPIAVDWL